MGLEDPTLPFATKKKITSALRRLLPNGQANEIGFGVNLRSLRNILVLRTSRHAEWEIRLVFNQIADLVRNKYPTLFEDETRVLIDDLYEITFSTDKL
jgi:thymidylate synthase ThyX